MNEYVLRTVILKDFDTGDIFWPAMMITTPDGDYVDTNTFTNDPTDYITVALERNGTIFRRMYKVHAKYEPVKMLDFGVVQKWHRGSSPNEKEEEK